MLINFRRSWPTIVRLHLTLLASYSLLHSDWPNIAVQCSYKDPKLYHHSNQQDSYPNTADSLFDSISYPSSIDESKLRLAFLVDEHIDTNKDQLVQLNELVQWIKSRLDKYNSEGTEKQWQSYNKLLKAENQNTLAWSDFVTFEHGHLLSLINTSNDETKKAAIIKSYNKIVAKDRRRWAAADQDSDDRLSKEEYKLFLYPEQSELMHSVVVDEKLEQMDLDKDGRISLDEYLADVSDHETNFNSIKRDVWTKAESLKFHNQLDLNLDKYLDKSEITKWVTKSELIDNSVAEAQHLMQSADFNKDHRLNKEEILLTFHEFVNSHATDFGEALRSQKPFTHEEL